MHFRRPSNFFFNSQYSPPSKYEKFDICMDAEKRRKSSCCHLDSPADVLRSQRQLGALLVRRPIEICIVISFCLNCLMQIPLVSVIFLSECFEEQCCLLTGDVFSKIRALAYLCTFAENNIVLRRPTLTLVFMTKFNQFCIQCAYSVQLP